MPRVIARDDRLRRGSDFERVRAGGRSYGTRMVVAIVLPNSLGRNRYGFAAGKRLGGAVERNRAKRLLREAARALHPALAPGHDIVFIARNALLPETHQAVVREQLALALRRAGLLPLEPPPAPDAVASSAETTT